MEQRKLTALVFGGTGAVGRELIAALVTNSNWNRIICVVRKTFPEWVPLKQLEIIKTDNLDELQQTDKWQFKGVDVVFCCLGSQTGQGKDIFVKVDKTYPLWIADIAKANKIRQYSLVSAVGSDPNSCFLYRRIKGEVEEQLKAKGFNVLSIFRPGFLKNRHDARCIERWVACCFPCFAAIDVREVALVLITDAEKVAQNPLIKGTFTYQNSNMLEMLAQ